MAPDTLLIGLLAKYLPRLLRVDPEDATALRAVFLEGFDEPAEIESALRRITKAPEYATLQRVDVAEDWELLVDLGKILGFSPEETMAYASKTSVTVEKSESELRRLLQKHGATAIMVGTQEEPPMASVWFQMEGLNIRLDVPLPSRLEDAVVYARKNAAGPAPVAVQHKRWDQICRSRWRSVLLLTRAKLEHIELGATTLQEEFLSRIVMPHGRTIGDDMIPQLDGLESVPLLESLTSSNGRNRPMLPPAGDDR